MRSPIDCARRAIHRDKPPSGARRAGPGTALGHNLIRAAKARLEPLIVASEQERRHVIALVSVVAKRIGRVLAIAEQAYGHGGYLHVIGLQCVRVAWVHEVESHHLSLLSPPAAQLGIGADRFQRPLNSTLCRIAATSSARVRPIG